MKIFIDIGHPADVHFFKNLVHLMAARKHLFYFSVRDKECTFALLDELSFDYKSRGTTGKNIFSKVLKLPLVDLSVLNIARLFNPDIFLSLGSPYAAHASCLLRKPNITFDDTEDAVYTQLLYKPFTDVILSPSCYYRATQKKRILFNGYKELCYLHPHYFKPDMNVINELGVAHDEFYAVIRFVAWNANHDFGQTGLSGEEKIRLVKEISQKCKVFISSEEQLPVSLEKYRLRTHPGRLHSILRFAGLHIGEGSTTAAESAVLGTPTIYVSSRALGYCNELEEKYNLLFNFRTFKGVLEKTMELISFPNMKEEWQKRRKKMLAQKIDMNAFMVWFLENYPQSQGMMIENPNFQDKFR
jgi:predicted glycosyltransferase